MMRIDRGQSVLATISFVCLALFYQGCGDPGVVDAQDDFSEQNITDPDAPVQAAVPIDALEALTSEPFSSSSRLSAAHVSVTASSSNGNHQPYNVLDRNLSTRWESSGSQALEFDFGETLQIDSISIAFHKGKKRTYEFDLVAVSAGGLEERVFRGRSAGRSNDPQSINTGGAFNARKLRYLGSGNGANSFNGITEVIIAATAIDAPAPPDDGGASSGPIGRAGEIDVIGVDASGYQTQWGHAPENAIDGDLDTRWYAIGTDEYLALDFAREEDIGAVEISFYNGNAQRYDFDLVALDRNGNATTVFSGLSSGNTAGLETLSISPFSAQSLIYEGKGNTRNNWNGINEIRLSKASPQEPPPAPAPAPSPGGSNADCSPEGGTLVWESGFENGFPGEWHKYNNGSYSKNGNMPAGRKSAWTIVDRSSGEPVRSGNHAYKAWINGRANENHRAYPILHVNFPTPLVNTFWVYQEVDFDALDPTDWIQFGTWGNNPNWAVHTMSIRNRRLSMAHLNPFHGTYVGPQPRKNFPLGRWVRMTVYLHYKGNSGDIHVWQDGVKVMEGRYTKRSGTNLMRAHWGLYADPEITRATQYNDDISLWSLSRPLRDLQNEPCF